MNAIQHRIFYRESSIYKKNTPLDKIIIVLNKRDISDSDLTQLEIYLYCNS